MAAWRRRMLSLGVPLLARPWCSRGPRDFEFPWARVSTDSSSDVEQVPHLTHELFQKNGLNLHGGVEAADAVLEGAPFS